MWREQDAEDVGPLGAARRQPGASRQGRPYVTLLVLCFVFGVILQIFLYWIKFLALLVHFHPSISILS